MRTVDFEYRGQVLHLCLNGAALFAIRDEYGSETPIFDLIAGDGSEAFQRMCRILHILCEQGELVERYLGQEPQEVPTERYLATTMMPSDLPAVREAMARALAAGFRREVPEDKPKRRDLGLEELQKKRDAAAGVAAGGDSGPWSLSAGGAAADAGDAAGPADPGA